jgi:hypothetical protein
MGAFLKELGMQQRFRKLALFVGATSLAGAGLIMVACGTDNGTATPTPGVDAAKVDGAKPDTGTTPDPDGSIPEGGTDADCTNNPQLRDNSGGFRCAFKAADAGVDASPTCANTEECCNTESKATGPGYCATGKDGTEALCIAQQPTGSTFNAGKGRVWECADKSACGAGQICCMISDPAQLALDPKNKVNIGKTLASDTRLPPACNVARVFKEGGSRCKTPAAGNCPDANDIKLCSLTDNNCGAGTVCTPFVDFTNFVDRGYCK